MGDLTMFGKSYNSVGNNSANLCLCTSGDVTIKTPGKFTTLFKNGKLAVDESFKIYTTDSMDSIKKNGIYIVTTEGDSGETNQAVYLYYDGETILLASTTDLGILYNSKQSLTPDQVLQALKNIGLYYETLQEAKDSGIIDGVVYILNEQNFYKVSGGNFTVFSNVSSENSESSDESSENPTTPEEQPVLTVGNITIDGSVTPSKIESAQLTLQNVYKVASMGAVQGSKGFLLYTKNSNSYIEADNLEVRGDFVYTKMLKNPEYIGTSLTNIITSYTTDTSSSDTGNSGSSNTYTGEIEFNLKYKNSFSVDDYIYIGLWIEEPISTTETSDESETESDTEQTNKTRTELIGYVVTATDYSVIVKFPTLTELTSQIKDVLVGAFIHYLGGSTKNKQLLYYNSDSISLKTVDASETEIQCETVTQIGDLGNISTNIKRDDVTLSGYGIYSDNLVATNPTFYGSTYFISTEEDYPKYDSNFEVPGDYDDDKYNRTLTSVSWVKSFLSSRDTAIEELRNSIDDINTAIDKINSDIADLDTKVDNITHPEYSLAKKATATAGYARTYGLTKNSVFVGTSINVGVSTIVKESYYDSDTQSIVIKFNKGGTSTETVKISLADLISSLSGTTT